MLFLVYVIAMIFISCLVKGKRKKRAEENGETDSSSYRFFRNVIIVLIVFVGMLLLIYSMVVQKHWIYFSDKRKAEIEKQFGITVDSDMKLKSYTVLNGRKGGNLVVKFKCDKDYDSFRKENCKGKIQKYGAKGVIYSNDGEGGFEKEDHFSSDLYEYGFIDYEYKKKNYRVRYKKEKNSYIVTIVGEDKRT